jgi:hypothetical protein
MIADRYIAGNGTARGTISWFGTAADKEDNGTTRCGFSTIDNPNALYASLCRAPVGTVCRCVAAILSPSGTAIRRLTQHSTTTALQRRLAALRTLGLPCSARWA